MSDKNTQKHGTNPAALSRISSAAGEADWHVSTAYDTDDVTQVVSISPEYDFEDPPWKGDVTLHALLATSDGVFNEVEITLPVHEMGRLARQYLALIDADQRQFESRLEATSEDDDEEDDDEEDDDDEDDDDDEEDADDDDDDDEDDDEEDADDDEDEDDDDEDEDDDEEDADDDEEDADDDADDEDEEDDAVEYEEDDEYAVEENNDEE
jgi:hypothetical protein